MHHGSDPVGARRPWFGPMRSRRCFTQRSDRGDRGMTTPCLRVENLNVMYQVGKQRLHAAKDVSLEIAPGETLGLVGESGSGKSTVGLAILRLIESSSGKIMLGDSDVMAAGRGELKTL